MSAILACRSCSISSNFKSRSLVRISFLFFDVRLKVDVVDDFVMPLVVALLLLQHSYFAIQLVLQLLLSYLIARRFNVGERSLDPCKRRLPVSYCHLFVALL